MASARGRADGRIDAVNRRMGVRSYGLPRRLWRSTWRREAATIVAVRREPDFLPPRATESEGAVPARVAFWLHRGAPGGDHVDLFIGPFDGSHPPPTDARLAWSWRLPVEAFPGVALEPHRPATQGRWPATPTEPHRMAYLMLDGDRELGEGRGTATLLARGDGWARFEGDCTAIRATLARAVGAAASAARPTPGSGIATELELEIAVRRLADGTASVEIRTPSRGMPHA